MKSKEIVNKDIDTTKLIQALNSIKNLYIEKENIKEEFIKYNNNYNSLLSEKRLEKEEIDNLTNSSITFPFLEKVKSITSDSTLRLCLILILPFKILLTIIIFMSIVYIYQKSIEKYYRSKLDLLEEIYYTKWNNIQNKEYKKLCDVREKYHTLNHKYHDLILGLSKKEIEFLEEFLNNHYNNSKEKLQTNESVVENHKKLIKSPN